MVSTNYSSCFQPLPSQEVRLVPYVEPPFTPTIDEHIFPYAEYMAEDEMGSYRVNVNVLYCSSGLTIEHVANGNLLMRVKIIREKLLSCNVFDYNNIVAKYHDWRIKQITVDSEQLLVEHEKIMSRFKESLANDNDKDMLDKAILTLGGVVVNSAIATKNALISTRDTVIKTATVARENISKLVFFCSYALVRVKPSEGNGGYCQHGKQMDKGKYVQFYFQSILERQNNFKQDSQNTSHSSSLVAQLLCNEKKM